MWVCAALGGCGVTVCAAPAVCLPEQAQPVLPEAPSGGGNPVAPAPEEPEAIILLMDGRRISGLLVERAPDAVVLRIGGIATRFGVELVDRVEVLPPVMERYRAMRAAIDDRDPDQLVQLAEWLRVRGKYDEAITELTHALSVRPGHVNATRLLALVRAQRELASRSGVRPASKPREPGAPPEAPRPRPEFPVLAPEQINTIKVYEINLKDPPDLVIKRETMAKLMERHAGDPLIPATAEAREALFKLSPARQLELMFKLQARDLYGEVQVVGNVPTMERFRDEVHRPWIINSCATNRCHGGREAGRLYLSNRKPNSESTVYTNFLILDRFRLEDGSPLIDYEEPERSPLLQMALPRRDSLFPHPPAPGPGGRGDLWKPAMRSANDRRFIEGVEWMKSMYRPRPEYPVAYQPPGTLAAEAATGSAPPEEPGKR